MSGSALPAGVRSPVGLAGRASSGESTLCAVRTATIYRNVTYTSALCGRAGRRFDQASPGSEKVGSSSSGTGFLTPGDTDFT